MYTNLVKIGEFLGVRCLGLEQIESPVLASSDLGKIGGHLENIWFGDDNHLRILVVVMIRCALCMVLLVVVMAAVQYFSVIYCNWTTN